MLQRVKEQVTKTKSDYLWEEKKQLAIVSFQWEVFSEDSCQGTNTAMTWIHQGVQWLGGVIVKGAVKVKGNNQKMISPPRLFVT